MEDKNGFILYRDLIHIVRKLPKDKAGEFFLTILEYVNDLNPVVDDFIISLVFEPVKQQLKRDLKKWEKELSNKSKAGALGNIKRWHRDLYDKILLGQITLEDATNTINHRKTSHTDGTVSQNIASIAVNETDTVIVNETVTVTETKSINASVMPLEIKTELGLWVEMRTKKRNKPTLHAIELGVKELNLLAPGDFEKQKEIINQSIFKGWAGFFPLKNQNNDNNKRNNGTGKGSIIVTSGRRAGNL